MRVFVHGVPETAAIWDGVRAELGDDSMAVSLPGFGSPRPDGFGATKEEYLDWLVGELEAIGDPVDLVGHDWGAGLTYGVALRRPDLLRSWAADVANIVHPDYVWHDTAQGWQTPQVGEQLFEAQLAMPSTELATMLEPMGLRPDQALEMAGAMDEAMAECILSLYRSATPNIHADWGPWSKVDVPGMVISLPGDPFNDVEMAAAVADQFGARVGVLDGPGHFWPYEDPQAGAAILSDYWVSI